MDSIKKKQQLLIHISNAAFNFTEKSTKSLIYRTALAFITMK